MKINTSEAQANVLRAVVNHGDLTSRQIAEKAGISIYTVHNGIKRFQRQTGDKYLKVVGKVFIPPSSHSSVYGLGDSIKGKPTEEILSMIVSTDKRKTRAPATEVDEQSVELIKLNQFIFSASAMRHALGATPIEMEKLTRLAGVSLDPEDMEPRAEDIARGIGLLPLGTEIERTSGWTKIHLHSEIPGINRVTRHYACGEAL